MMRFTPGPASQRALWPFDLLFICLAATFAWLAFAGLIPLSGHGAVMDSDLMTYAQGMAGQSHPELFAQDPVLHSQNAANSIQNLERILASWLAGSDAWADGLLTAGCIAIFTFYLGWYSLGRWLYGSPCLAAMLALACGITVWVGWGTFWGINHSDPVPRVFYAALLPFLLFFGLCAMTRPWLRPVTMALAGLMMWVHGISALNGGAMLFLAFLFNPGPKTKLTARLLNLLACLVAFFVPVLAFLWPSLMQPRSFTAAELDTFQQLMALRWREDYAGFGARMLAFFSPWGPVFPILAGGAAGFCLTIFKGGKREKLFCRMAGPFALALIAVAAFSFGESHFAPVFGRLPMGHELVRGMRFLVPIGWILIFCGISCLLGHRLRRLALLVLVCCWLAFSKDRQIAAAQYAIYAHTGLELPLAQPAARAEAEQWRKLLLALQEIVPQGEAVYSPSDVMPVRYIALRPLAHSFKDGYVHFYNKDLTAARRWLKLENLAQNSDQGWLGAWRASGAPWALLPDNLRKEARLAGKILLDQNGWLLVRKNG